MRAHCMYLITEYNARESQTSELKSVRHCRLLLQLSVNNVSLFHEVRSEMGAIAGAAEQTTSCSFRETNRCPYCV